jgi:hypothetical protein
MRAQPRRIEAEIIDRKPSEDGYPVSGVPHALPRCRSFPLLVALPPDNERAEIGQGDQRERIERKPQTKTSVRCRDRESAPPDFLAAIPTATSATERS